MTYLNDYSETIFKGLTREPKVRETMEKDDAGPADLHDFTVAERYDYLLKNPQGASHLFSLLAKGKGDADSFNTMLCRIIRSARRATQASTGGE